MQQSVFDNMALPTVSPMPRVPRISDADPIPEQRMNVLVAVKRWPGRTQSELAANIRSKGGRLGTLNVGLRLAELERARLIDRGPRRRCRATGMEGALTWIDPAKG